jgi:hypothetical protein
MNMTRLGLTSSLALLAIATPPSGCLFDFDFSFGPCGWSGDDLEGTERKLCLKPSTPEDVADLMPKAAHRAHVAAGAKLAFTVEPDTEIAAISSDPPERIISSEINDEATIVLGTAGELELTVETTDGTRDTFLLEVQDPIGAQMGVDLPCGLLFCVQKTGTDFVLLPGAALEAVSYPVGRDGRLHGFGLAPIELEDASVVRFDVADAQGEFGTLIALAPGEASARLGELDHRRLTVIDPAQVSDLAIHVAGAEILADGGIGIEIGQSAYVEVFAVDGESRTVVGPPGTELSIEVEEASDRDLEVSRTIIGNIPRLGLEPKRSGTYTVQIGWLGATRSLRVEARES